VVAGVGPDVAVAVGPGLVEVVGEAVDGGGAGGGRDPAAGGLLAGHAFAVVADGHVQAGEVAEFVEQDQRLAGGFLPGDELLGGVLPAGEELGGEPGERDGAGLAGEGGVQELPPVGELLVVVGVVPDGEVTEAGRGEDDFGLGFSSGQGDADRAIESGEAVEPGGEGGHQVPGDVTGQVLGGGGLAAGDCDGEAVGCRGVQPAVAGLELDGGDDGQVLLG